MVVGRARRCSLRTGNHAMVGLVVIAGREGTAVKMPVRRDHRTGAWFFRTTVKTPDGKSPRLFGTPGAPGPFQDLAPTKSGAQEAERRAIQNAFARAIAGATPAKKEVPTFHEWFNGRFWREWVIARRNKPTEVRSKQYIYERHLKPAFGDVKLDEIHTSDVAAFRASLVEKGLGDKRINNVLAVLSKPLRYAVDCELIGKSPKIGMYKTERPEIEPWDFEQYARLVAAAKIEGADWYAAVCLAGEA